MCRDTQEVRSACRSLGGCGTAACSRPLASDGQHQQLVDSTGTQEVGLEYMCSGSCCTAACSSLPASCLLASAGAHVCCFALPAVVVRRCCLQLARACSSGWPRANLKVFTRTAGEQGTQALCMSLHACQVFCSFFCGCRNNTCCHTYCARCALLTQVDMLAQLIPGVGMQLCACQTMCSGCRCMHIPAIDRMCHAAAAAAVACVQDG
jgi:hypothetical protein